MLDHTWTLVGDPILRGHVAIDALWFPHGWRDEAARQRQILEAWRPGCRAYRFEHGDLLCHAQAQAGDCDGRPGWPLRRIAGSLCSAAIRPADLAGRPAADVWLAVGGVVQGLRLSDAVVLDPSCWLAVEYGWIEPFRLELPEAARQLVVPPARALRQVLGPAVPAAASEGSLRFLQALKPQEAEAAVRQGADQPRRPAPRQLRIPAPLASGALMIGSVLALAHLPGFIAGDLSLGSFLLALIAAMGVARLLQPLRAAARAAAGAAARPGAGGQAKPRANGHEGGKAPSSLRARLAQRAPQGWRDWAARWSMHLGLQRLLGSQHAAYVRRMLAMFDEGRIEDALRHAVPLGDEQGSLGQAFGRLGPRKDLSLQSQRGAGTSVSVGQDLEQHLRALYRRTFERLDALGRIDEATFVLAELLRARQEALDYLEKHGRFQQAAELAFGWDMPAAQIVRLQALAGQWRQAVLVALRDNAFAEAVVMLERRWPEAAARLRREWAETLAAQTRWLEAVQVLWPLEDQRPRAAQWLCHVEAAGGTLAARALALRVQFQPESLSSHDTLIRALRDDPALAAERAALAQELLKTRAPVEPALRRLAGLTAGMTIADQSGPRPTLDAGTLQSLIKFAADAALAADLPQSGPAWLGLVARPVTLNAEAVAWEVPPPGTVPLFDAVPLADGEFLVALGEAGAARLDARGRRLVHFDKPAHRLVISADGSSALALAPRERVWRVTRLDLASRSTVDLGLHAFDAFADRFDGAGWTVGVGRSMQVLDTTAGLNEVLWQVADLPGRVVLVDSCHDTELLVLRDDSVDPPQFQQWNYALPGRRLRSRELVPELSPGAEDVVARRIFARRVGLIDLQFDRQAPGRARAAPALAPDKPWAEMSALDPADAVMAASGWLLARSDASIRLIECRSGRVRGSWPWPEAAGVGLRYADGVWLVFDREGRLATIDVETGVARSLSVR